MFVGFSHIMFNTYYRNRYIKNMIPLIPYAYEQHEIDRHWLRFLQDNM